MREDWIRMVKIERWREVDGVERDFGSKCLRLGLWGEKMRWVQNDSYTSVLHTWMKGGFFPNIGNMVWGQGLAGTDMSVVLGRGFPERTILGVICIITSALSRGGCYHIFTSQWRALWRWVVMGRKPNLRLDLLSWYLFQVPTLLIARCKTLDKLF